MRDTAVIRRKGKVVKIKSVGERVFTGNERGSMGTAYWNSGYGAREINALACKSIDMRGDHFRIA